jgi:hypothetical protein
MENLHKKIINRLIYDKNFEQAFILFIITCNKLEGVKQKNFVKYYNDQLELDNRNNHNIDSKNNRDDTKFILSKL